MTLSDHSRGTQPSYSLPLNLYDPCVTKTVVGEEKMTVVFHVDDLKVSHKSDKDITKVIEYLDGIYPGIKAVLGDVHDYLGMRFDHSTKGQVEIPMNPHMKK